MKRDQIENLFSTVHEAAYHKGMRVGMIVGGVIGTLVSCVFYYFIL